MTFLLRRLITFVNAIGLHLQSNFEDNEIEYGFCVNQKLVDENLLLTAVQLDCIAIRR